MLTISVVCVALATAVVLFATMKKFASQPQQQEILWRDHNAAPADKYLEQRLDQWGKRITAVAIIYALALLSGLFYIGWHNGQPFMK